MIPAMIYTAREGMKKHYNIYSKHIILIPITMMRYILSAVYHRLQDYDNAKIYYELIVNNFQDTRRYDSAKSYGQIQD